jgi:hypothetical protein
MSRLTNGIREQMARKLVTHRYTDEAKDIIRKSRDLFERAHAQFYSAALLKHMTEVRKVFPDCFVLSTEMQVNAGGYKVRIGVNLGFSRWVRVPVEKNPPQKLIMSGYWTHHLTDEKLIEDIKAFAIRREGFDRVCETAYSEAMSVLNTMTTGKKLAEAWPEAMAVIGDLIPEDQRTLPVVQVSAINAKFKLPPETKTKETV